MVLTLLISTRVIPEITSIPVPQNHPSQLLLGEVGVRRFHRLAEEQKEKEYHCLPPAELDSIEQYPTQRNKYTVNTTELKTDREGGWRGGGVEE